MGTTCLTVCPECSRHLRCGERACPFCGARVSTFLRVLEYRLKNRLSRGQGFSLSAALTAVGIVASSSDISCIAAYGSPCMRSDTCEQGGSSGGVGGVGGAAGRGGTAGGTGAPGLVGGTATTGGSVPGGSAGNDGNDGNDGNAGSAGSAGVAGSVSGGANEATGGDGGAGGAGGAGGDGSR
jgi:hypothetical protein